MGTIAWAGSIAEAKQRAKDDERLLLTYIFSPT